MKNLVAPWSTALRRGTVTCQGDTFITPCIRPERIKPTRMNALIPIPIPIPIFEPERYDFMYKSSLMSKKTYNMIHFVIFYK